MGIFDMKDSEEDSETIACKVELNQEDVLNRIQDHALDVVLLQERFKAAKIALDTATEGLAMALPHTMREVGEHVCDDRAKLLVQTRVAEKTDMGSGSDGRPYIRGQTIYLSA